MVYSIRNSERIFSHANHRGDVIARSSGNGSLTWFALYEAYGIRAYESGINPDRQKANTKDEEAEIGLLQEGMRLRDLELGVFLTPDPIGYADGPNIYCYVHCNPITHFDAFGLSENHVSAYNPDLDVDLTYSTADYVSYTELTANNFDVMAAESTLAAGTAGAAAAVPGVGYGLAAAPQVIPWIAMGLEGLDMYLDPGMNATFAMCEGGFPVPGDVTLAKFADKVSDAASTTLKSNADELLKVVYNLDVSTPQNIRRFVRQSEVDRIQHAMEAGDNTVSLGRWWTSDSIDDVAVATERLALPNTVSEPIVGYIDVAQDVLPSGYMQSFGPREVLPYADNELGRILPGLGTELNYSSYPQVPVDAIQYTPNR